MKNTLRQKIYRTIMLIVVVAIITFVVTTILIYDGSLRYIVDPTASGSNVSKKLDTLLSTVTELIDQKYLGEVDEEELIDGALKGLVDSVGDKYTEYYTKEDMENFNAQTIGNFIGIGAVLQGDYEKEEITILSVIKDAPAEKAGVKKRRYDTKSRWYRI